MCVETAPDHRNVDTKSASEKKKELMPWWRDRQVELVPSTGMFVGLSSLHRGYNV